MEQIIWTLKAKNSLKLIWDFYAKTNVKLANKIIKEIIETAENIKFGTQYQVEELLPEYNYRRVVVRHFKIIYKVHKDTLEVLRVFDTRQNPNKLKD